MYLHYVLEMLLQCFVRIAMLLVFLLLLKLVEVLNRLQLPQHIGIIQQLLDIVVLQESVKDI